MSALEQDTSKIDNSTSNVNSTNVNTTPNDSSAPGACNDQVLRSQALLNLGAGRDALLSYFKNTWSLTEMLFSGLAKEEAFYRRPYHKTRHPLIFYYAHPVCFYVNKLLVSGMIDKPVNADFELLFETGVDEMNWDDLHDGEQEIWPPLSEVKAYRQQVYDLMCLVINSDPAFAEPVTMDSPAWGVVMGFEHERIHLETSSVLMRELPIGLVQTPENWPLFPAAPVTGTSTEPSAENSTGNENTQDPLVNQDYPDNSDLIAVSATQVQLGKPKDWPSFGWDNEYGSDHREVENFKASPFLVSNGEFFQFVKDRGYETERYWTESSWGWRRFRNVKWPTFWVQDGPAGSNRFRLRTTFEEIDMQWDWPAVVNYYEAKAYCVWLTERQQEIVPFRLISEAEHHVLRGSSQRALSDWKAGQGQEEALDAVMKANDSASAKELSSSNKTNHNLQFGSESPVNHFAANENGFHDVFGNVWQWCEDAFHPLPEFEIHPYYTDFSSPCFDGEHQMMLGGSFISTGDEASIWSRFHFRPHFFQHSGFRLAQSVNTDLVDGDKYESDELVNQYLLFHFGSDEEQRDEAITSKVGHPTVANLITRTVDLVNQFSPEFNKVLDLGCAVGRASFELSQSFGNVIGVDYSEAFVDVANQLKADRSMSYRRRETGRYFTELLAELPDQCRHDRTQFYRGDASSLDALEELQKTDKKDQSFDAILLSNLLCRLSDPAGCLRQFVETDQYLAKGGILVIASPNTWMEQFTEVENFLDGEDSEATKAAIGSKLPGFENLHVEDVPFMIREHRRKYEYIVSQVTVWRKL